MIVEVILVAVIVVLLALLLFSAGSILWVRRFAAEVNEMRAQVGRTQVANEALRNNLSAMVGERSKSFSDAVELVRDLETLRSAIAGSSECQKLLAAKYGGAASPELVDRILASKPKIDRETKRRLAHELLVGEVGREMLRGFRDKKSIEQASAGAGVPVAVGKSQIRRLQVLGYLNERLELTERGQEALF
jgi:hypothetical protein